MSAASVCTSIENPTNVQRLLRAHCEVNGMTRECRILDLKANRAFVESYVPAVTGSQVNLQFNLPNQHPISANGVVSHHQFTVGFSVEFTDLSANDCEQLKRFAY